MMGWAGELTWTGWIVMAVCMFAFWAVVIYLVAMMFRTDRANGPGRTSPESDPLRLLEAGFARGDIDSEEFVARRQVLMHPGDTTSVEHRQGQVHD
ncbi:SHOCT domain-containing protein [Rhodococcus sp. BL-253-APC-6A1W]|uniref:SHOCT domain-containing protein n=1 Tax=Rhodococcus sp. BL-253-APC-6A1W TaxID=2725307 RepID=UPI00146E51BC|nr:SHOCT domain-containing protein [Rhodococcus sp. BL-253-APC-6A1W]NMD96628.1 SHOCT domain-containing protein [Rhodococcus sp. BL-253-APC-6A1W]